MRKEPHIEIASHEAVLLMRPRSIFDFVLSGRIFRDGDPHIESYADGIFSRIVRVGDSPVLIKVRGTGTVEKPGLTVRAVSHRALTSDDKTGLRNKIGRLLNLDFDLGRFYRECRRDLVLSRTVKGLYGLRPVNTETAYEALSVPSSSSRSRW